MRTATTLDQALLEAKAMGLARLDAQLLLLHALGRQPSERAWLLAHGGDVLESHAWALWQTLRDRRAAGEPMAYILGWAAFYGLDLHIDARVLCPRADTETLVDWALAVLPRDARVVDLGTGSGAIALALKHQRPDVHVHARDSSTDALDVAQANAQRLGLSLTFSQGEWLEGLAGPFDAIVSNPPYIAQEDPHLFALRHEPIEALASGPDGLDDLRVIIEQAPASLKCGGWLLLEHGYDQSLVICALLQAKGFTEVQSRHDLAGIARCSGGRWA